MMATNRSSPGRSAPLVLDHITIDPQVVQMVPAQGAAKVVLTLSQQLAGGWERCFVWETLIAVGFAAIPLIAVAAVRSGPRSGSCSGRLAVVCLVNVGGIAVTAAARRRSAQRQDARQPGRRGPGHRACPDRRGQPAVQAVVIGDSTAAGSGLPWVWNSSLADQASAVPASPTRPT